MSDASAAFSSSRRSMRSMKALRCSLAKVLCPMFMIPHPVAGARSCRDASALAVAPITEDDAPQQSEPETLRLERGAEVGLVYCLFAIVDEIAVRPAQAWHVVFRPGADVDAGFTGPERQNIVPLC